MKEARGEQIFGLVINLNAGHQDQTRHAHRPRSNKNTTQYELQSFKPRFIETIIECICCKASSVNTYYSVPASCSLNESDERIISVILVLFCGLIIKEDSAKTHKINHELSRTTTRLMNIPNEGFSFKNKAHCCNYNFSFNNPFDADVYRPKICE